MQLDYNLLLDNIKRRRFDEAVRDHILSASFLDDGVPEPVRYSLESMQEVDQAYTYKVYANTRKIEAEITKTLEAEGVQVDVRYQGPLRTETHIRLFGEIDMLFILDEKAGGKDVFALGQRIKELLVAQHHQNVDYSSGLKIHAVTQKPACKINIIPATWINNPRFMEKKNEIYRGVALYNFKAKTRMKNLPFLNMARINVKDVDTNGGFKQVIRLLKSLSTDESVDLTSYELAGLIYGIDDSQITPKAKLELAMLPVVNNHIKTTVADSQHFESLLSPSEKELVFGNRQDKKDAVSKLQNALEKLIGDLGEHLGSDLSEPVSYNFESTDHSDSE